MGNPNSKLTLETNNKFPFPNYGFKNIYISARFIIGLKNDDTINICSSDHKPIISSLKNIKFKKIGCTNDLIIGIDYNNNLQLEYIRFIYENIDDEITFFDPDAPDDDANETSFYVIYNKITNKTIIDFTIYGDISIIYTDDNYLHFINSDLNNIIYYSQYIKYYYTDIRIIDEQAFIAYNTNELHIYQIGNDSLFLSFIIDKINININTIKFVQNKYTMKSYIFGLKNDNTLIIYNINDRIDETNKIIKEDNKKLLFIDSNKYIVIGIDINNNLFIYKLNSEADILISKINNKIKYKKIICNHLTSYIIAIDINDNIYHWYIDISDYYILFEFLPNRFDNLIDIKINYNYVCALTK
jgi:hypothetical protein